MRVYHLLSRKWALCDLKHRRLKVARFSDLNDPFELRGVQLEDRAQRKRLDRWCKRIAGEYGLLCFSSTWHNPVLWSHYAGAHRGMCLGFEVPDCLLREVQYLNTRPPLEDLSENGHPPSSLFYTKFDSWAYEDEYRRIVRLRDAHMEGTNHFWPFDEDLRLRQIIVGARCRNVIGRLQEVLDGAYEQVVITQGRCAFRDFRVTEDLRGVGGTRSARTSR